MTWLRRALAILDHVMLAGIIVYGLYATWTFQGLWYLVKLTAIAALYITASINIRTRMGWEDSSW